MTYRCAVIGNPIAHSKSPDIHAGFARARGIALEYTRILAERDNFADIVKDFFAKGGRGLNITLPFKETAFALAECHTPYAQAAGAANTLWMESGQLWADNTDGRGLIRALTHDHRQTFENKRILLLGAGGAARGALLPLIEASPAHLHIANRSADKAQTLAAPYENAEASGLDALAALPAFDLIINATSAGLNDGKFDLPASLAHPHTFAYDMLYGKDTAFLQWAQSHTLAHADGYTMLVNQARLSFQQWFPA